MEVDLPQDQLDDQPLPDDAEVPGLYDPGRNNFAGTLDLVLPCCLVEYENKILLPSCVVVPPSGNQMEERVLG